MNNLGKQKAIQLLVGFMKEAQGNKTLGERADTVDKYASEIVRHQRKLLITFANELQTIGFNEMDDVEKVVDIWFENN